MTGDVLNWEPSGMDTIWLGLLVWTTVVEVGVHAPHVFMTAKKETEQILDGYP